MIQRIENNVIINQQINNDNNNNEEVDQATQNQNQIVMASIRRIKNEIDYLVSEVISDGYMALYFNGEKRDAIVAVIEEAVAMRNKLYDQVNHPADKQNKSLVRKHYAQVRRDMMSGVDGLFRKLSDICK